MREKPCDFWGAYFFLLGREHFSVTLLSSRLYAGTFAFVYLSDQTSAVLASEDRYVLDIDTGSISGL